MRKKHSNRQIFMITDGKPTALFEGNELYLNPFGLDQKIVRRTLNEAAECRRYGIPITTFMLARDPLLVDFVKQLTEVNHGRAYFSSLRDLEQKVFVDFIRNRSRNAVRGSGSICPASSRYRRPVMQRRRVVRVMRMARRPLLAMRPRRSTA